MHKANNFTLLNNYTYISKYDLRNNFCCAQLPLTRCKPSLASRGENISNFPIWIQNEYVVVQQQSQSNGGKDY